MFGSPDLILANEKMNEHNPDEAHLLCCKLLIQAAISRWKARQQKFTIE